MLFYNGLTNAKTYVNVNNYFQKQGFMIKISSFPDLLFIKMNIIIDFSIYKKQKSTLLKTIEFFLNI